MFKSGKPRFNKGRQKVENPVENKNKIVEKRKTKVLMSSFSQNDLRAFPFVSPIFLAIKFFSDGTKLQAQLLVWAKQKAHFPDRVHDRRMIFAAEQPADLLIGKI